MSWTSAAIDLLKSSSRPASCPVAALVDVGVPAADVGEGDLEADIGLDQLGDLPEVLPERRPRIVGAVLRQVLLRVR